MLFYDEKTLRLDFAGIIVAEMLKLIVLVLIFVINQFD